MDGARGQKNLLRYRGHCRAVLRGIEQPQPVWTVGSLCDVLPILRDSATALKYIHGAGWVHRDISAGNIYFFKEQEARGLIGDLEDAKTVTTDGSHEIRTGSPDFMAIGVLLGTYLFDPPPSPEPEDVYRDRLKERARGNKPVSKSMPLIPFVQNEAHDVESIWWVANYILFFNSECGIKETPSQQEARMECMQKIFPSSSVFDGRLRFLKNPTDYGNDTSWFPGCFLELREGLEDLRHLLVRSYYKFERTLPTINWNAFDGLHDAASDAFEGNMRIAQGITITSFKSLGRKYQDDRSPSRPGPAPAELPSADASKGQRELTNFPNPPGKKLALHQP